MGSRQMLVCWRIYVYTHNLYSLPNRRAESFRNWSPGFFRNHSDELQRLLSFANRDLSVLIPSSRAKVLKVFELLVELVPTVRMSSASFQTVLTPHLNTHTEHFIHELINFARSPFDDLITYECNVKYEPRVATDELLGLQCFVDFTQRVDEDEWLSFDLELELEDEEIDEIDVQTEMCVLNEPLFLELRRLLTERNAQLTAEAQVQSDLQSQLQVDQLQSQLARQYQAATQHASVSARTLQAAAAATTTGAGAVLAAPSSATSDLEFLDYLQRRSRLQFAGNSNNNNNNSSISNNPSLRHLPPSVVRAVEAGAVSSSEARNNLRTALRVVSASRPRNQSVTPKRRHTNSENNNNNNNRDGEP
ncbi:E3 ubiquitin-protein ligase Topors [Drosophila busckii]|uniref:E3 ubiquitin-protein ligase Topors n=1 Tax=Drosophila busckii TaxID=30019 RepID=UPI00083EDA59|nr:E3 ubiquitin-protein ligase Topors [Drosophila busckii]XP_017836444.1 E3 ubiquitin-protein ligase Topors [Drosophila busckii]